MITQADVARMREFRKGEIFAMAVGDTMPVIGSENSIVLRQGVNLDEHEDIERGTLTRTDEGVAIAYSKTEELFAFGEDQFEWGPEENVFVFAFGPAAAEPDLAPRTNDEEQSANNADARCDARVGSHIGSASVDCALWC